MPDSVATVLQVGAFPRQKGLSGATMVSWFSAGAWHRMKFVEELARFGDRTSGASDRAARKTMNDAAGDPACDDCGNGSRRRC